MAVEGEIDWGSLAACSVGLFGLQLTADESFYVIVLTCSPSLLRQLNWESNKMNSFSDPNPEFPYQSSEAAMQLGLPDSPEIHLAVTTVASLLLPIASLTSLDIKQQRVAVLRVASGAVLFGWSLTSAEQMARVHLNLPILEGCTLPQSRMINEKDWLAEAANRLCDEGVAIKSGVQRQRSNYGWRSS